MSYNHIQISKELDATALGDSYHGNALYVARDMPWATHNDKLMLTRWLNGSQTSSDFHALQDFAILTRNEGKMPDSITQYYKDRQASGQSTLTATR